MRNEGIRSADERDGSQWLWTASTYCGGVPSVTRTRFPGVEISVQDGLARGKRRGLGMSIITAGTRRSGGHDQDVEDRETRTGTQTAEGEGISL